MLTIDGAFGEGGGQILRSSLALSMLTGKAVRIERIRANRPNPGLRRQHLTAVQAAAQVSSARVEGDRLGSTELTFEPGEVRPGEYAFAVGTAGSTTLVVQTVLPVLLTAPGPSRLTLEGGTHNPMAPPFDFLERTFLPLIQRMGPKATVALERPGFYPVGGGRLSVAVEPAHTLQGFDLLERGEVRRREVRAIVADLPRHIGEREIALIRRALSWPAECGRIEQLSGCGPGNVVFIEIECENLTAIFTGFGERGRRAEAVATGTVETCERWLRAGVPVGPYLADQLLLPLAVAGHGRFLTMTPTQHTTTHIDLIGRFLELQVRVEQEDEDRYLIAIGE